MMNQLDNVTLATLNPQPPASELDGGGVELKRDRSPAVLPTSPGRESKGNIHALETSISGPPETSGTCTKSENDDEVQFISSAPLRPDKSREEKLKFERSVLNVQDASNASGHPSELVEPEALSSEKRSVTNQNNLSCESTEDLDSNRVSHMACLDSERLLKTGIQERPLPTSFPRGSAYGSSQMTHNNLPYLQRWDSSMPSVVSNWIFHDDSRLNGIYDKQISNKKRKLDFECMPGPSNDTPLYQGLPSGQCLYPTADAVKAPFGFSVGSQHFMALEDGFGSPSKADGIETHRNDRSIVSSDRLPTWSRLDHSMTNEQMQICGSPIAPPASHSGRFLPSSDYLSISNACTSMPGSQPYSGLIFQPAMPNRGSPVTSSYVPTQLQTEGCPYSATSALGMEGYFARIGTASGVMNMQDPRHILSSSESQLGRSDSTFRRPTNQKAPGAGTCPSSPTGIRATCTSADIQRRPSLYTVPRWASPPVSPMTIHQPHSRNYQPVYSSHIVGDEQRTGNNNEPRISVKRSQLPISASLGSCDQTGRIVNMNASQHESTVTLTSDQQSMQKTSRRKHSPNLIIDIAETCQENFPFAAVAERHEVPVQKVMDTFSAIVQLPLLRSADDKRRHGSIGKRRMKDYRDAKRAMEKVQESEKKTQ